MQIRNSGKWRFVCLKKYGISYQSHLLTIILQVSRCSLYRNWAPVTEKEMKGFVAIILNMGLDQRKYLKDYWSTLESDMPFYRSVFSRDRFLQIFGMLHIGENTGRKKDKIEPLLNLVLPIIQTHYSPHKEISIDEAVISFKGRVAFRQYLKGKPHPWGIKAFVLADSKTAYLYNLAIYYGRDTDLIRPDLPHTDRAVLTLTEGLQHEGHDLYVDRFYSSPLLAVIRPGNNRYRFV